MVLAIGVRFPIILRTIQIMKLNIKDLKVDDIVYDEDGIQYTIAFSENGVVETEPYSDEDNEEVFGVFEDEDGISLWDNPNQA